MADDPGKIILASSVTLLLRSQGRRSLVSRSWQSSGPIGRAFLLSYPKEADQLRGLQSCIYRQKMVKVYLYSFKLSSHCKCGDAQNKSESNGPRARGKCRKCRHARCRALIKKSAIIIMLKDVCGHDF